MKTPDRADPFVATTLALGIASALLLPGADAGAVTLPNGGSVLGSLPVIGAEDMHDFTASFGDHIELRAASTDPLYPEIELRDPMGGLVDTGTDCCVAVVTHTVVEPGTFTVLVRDGLGNRVGDYELFFTRIPGANELGTLINGPVNEETIDLGDLDTYTFSAGSGNHIELRMGRASGNLYPRIKLYDPSGALLDQGSDASDAMVVVSGVDPGTYTVQIASSLQRNSGDYDLHLARIPGAGENGFLIDEFIHPGEITLADLDTFLFVADVGDNITLDLVRTSGNFYTDLELYGPSGALVAGMNGVGSASVAHTTAESGLYTVLVQDGLGRRTGTYTLEFTTDGGPPEVPTMPLALLALLGGILAATGGARTYQFSAAEGGSRGAPSRSRIAPVRGTSEKRST